MMFCENNNPKTNLRDFQRKLGLSLIKDYLRRRKNMENLPRDLRKRIHEQVGETINHFASKCSKPLRRCKESPKFKD